jgi:predicted DNA-binding protein YlxM (UPF0122 family)
MPKLTLAFRIERRAEMQRLFFQENWTLQQIAEKFNVSPQRVSIIIRTEPLPYGRPINAENPP